MGSEVNPQPPSEVVGDLISPHEIGVDLVSLQTTYQMKAISLEEARQAPPGSVIHWRPDGQPIALITV